MAQAQYHFGRNKIQYDDFEWQVLKTEHFDVHYYPEMQELAEHGAYFAEEVYKELENKFNYSLNHRVPLIFYSSNLHFKQTNTFPGFIPDGVGGFYEFLKGRVVIPANGDIHRFRRVIRHELIHVFTFMKAFRILKEYRLPISRNLPLWFTEGIAEYWSGEPDYQHEMILRDAIFSNYLVPLESMYRINGSYLMYKQGEAICRFISEEYGEEMLLRLIENSWQSKDFRKVMEITLHQDFEEIAAAWDVWLKEQYLPVLEHAVPPALSTEAIALRGFSSKPSFYQFKDGTRKVFYIGNRTGYTNLYQRELDSLYNPIGKEEVLVKGERGARFEAFHFFESRTSVSKQGKLAFVTKRGGTNSIHIYDLEKDELEGSLQFKDLVAIYSPTWSPSGTDIAFSSISQSGYNDLYIFDLESETLERLTDDIYDERNPSWSPDGRHIAFSSDRTSTGERGSYNLFLLDLRDRNISYVTHGDHHDFSPHWSPDGSQLLYTSARKDSTGRYGAQDIWAIDLGMVGEGNYELPEVASTEIMPSFQFAEPLTMLPVREARRLTNITTAAYDPVWTEDDNLIFSSFERLGFSIRSLTNVDSLFTNPQSVVRSAVASADQHWNFDKITAEDGAEYKPYKRKYTLDIAQGQVSQNPVLGTYGGALISFSDLMSNDRWFITMYNLGRSRSDFLSSMNVAITRVQYNRRANFSYGLYRFGGERFDITDPDADGNFPFILETIYGGSFGVSYPISMFKRIELNSALSWSDFDFPRDREALLLSNALSFVHDNTLYGRNGPIQGWRGNLTAAYTSDIAYSNVSYYTLMADLRYYLRLTDEVTFASRLVGRLNEGKEARRFILGGSWDLRGKRIYSVRGSKMWFTSHELRFPIMNYPSIMIPLLAPFGIVNLRGALFFDAAHAWNGDYNFVQEQINAGETLGAAGVGFRMNVFGGIVLRYDIGYAYRDGFRQRSDDLFKQFFFGFDF